MEFHRNASDVVPSLESEADTSSAQATAAPPLTETESTRRVLYSEFFCDRTEVLKDRTKEKTPFVHINLLIEAHFRVINLHYQSIKSKSTPINIISGLRTYKF